MRPTGALSDVDNWTDHSDYSIVTPSPRTQAPAPANQMVLAGIAGGDEKQALFIAKSSRALATSTLAALLLGLVAAGVGMCKWRRRHPR